MIALLAEPMPHDAGAERIAGMPAVTRAVFDRLRPELQARAFVITGVEALDAVARVRGMVAELPVGGDFREVKARILDEISPWLVTAEDAEERAKQMAAASRRAELLLRMHGWQAYAQTQYEQMEANKDVFPYRQYLTSEDARVRASHAALNRKILPAGHPFWLNHTPPWEFNCRCDCVPMTAEEVEQIRAAEAGKPPEDRLVLPPEQLRQIEEQKRIVKPGGQGFLDIRTPRERDGVGYEFRPEERALSIEQILERHSPEDRRIFEEFAARQVLDDGRTLLEWWAGAAPAPAPGPPVSPVPVPAPAPVPAVRDMVAVARAVDALAADHTTYRAVATASRAALVQALQHQRLAPAGTDPAALVAAVDAARKSLKVAEDALESVLERAREAVSIPAAERGAVTITTRNAKPLAAYVKKGGDLAARYTAKALLPSVGVKSLRGRRAFHRDGTIHVNTSTPLSTVAHEITHATEQQSPTVLQAARDFLLRRGGGQPTISLRRATGLGYRADERAWEDEWVARGGNLYAGKDYGPRATEILTMGIERLHADPVAFRRDDPDYFEFVVKTLQQLP